MEGRSPDGGVSRIERSERRAKTFYDPQNGVGCLDTREVAASRDYHIRHWIELAERVIMQDHNASFHGENGMAENVRATLADYPSDEIPPELQQALLKDVAFMKGQVEALEHMNRIFRRAAVRRNASVKV